MGTVRADDLAREKAALRQRLGAARRAIPLEQRARMASRVEDRLFALPAVRDARSVLVFSSFGSEIPTDRLVERLAVAGKRVLLPILEGGQMYPAELRPGERLATSGYGPKEPEARVPADPGEIDVVIAPGLAFDREGYRVGYGGGHYDAFLARMGRVATRIGIGFHLQVVDRVPRGPGDEPLDLVVTERETIECRRAGA